MFLQLRGFINSSQYLALCFSSFHLHWTWERKNYISCISCCKTVSSISMSEWSSAIFYSTVQHVWMVWILNTCNLITLYLHIHGIFYYYKCNFYLRLESKLKECLQRDNSSPNLWLHLVKATKAALDYIIKNSC
jgi:hypothetical protein